MPVNNASGVVLSLMLPISPSPSRPCERRVHKFLQALRLSQRMAISDWRPFHLGFVSVMSLNHKGGCFDAFSGVMM